MDDSFGGKTAKTIKSLSAKLSDHPQDKALFADGLGPELLLWAASCGQIRIIQLLVDAGVNVDSKDERGRTSLHLAVERYHPQLVRFLLRANASINARTTAGYQAGIKGLVHHNMTALHLAVVNGHKDILMMLLEGGAIVDAQDGKKWTALHLAAESGRKDVVRALLHANADVHMQDEGGSTPLRWAALNGHSEVVRSLLEAGAEVDCKDSEGTDAVELGGGERPFGSGEIAAGGRSRGRLQGR